MNADEDSTETNGWRNELLSLQEADHRNGQLKTVEEYIVGEPRAARDRDLMVDLILNDFQFRTGDAMERLRADLVQRFPQFGSDLDKLVEIHMLDVGDDVLSGTSTAPYMGGGGNGPEPDASGQQMPFDVRAQIKVGGFGAIFKGHDNDLDRPVALKTLNAKHNDGDARQRFERLEKLTAQLQHPAIMPIYRRWVREHDNRLFYVMPYVGNENLHDAVSKFHSPSQRPRRSLSQWMEADERNVELGRLIGYVVTVCKAAQFAHERRILHRDITPRNIMLWHGGAILIDWGLSKRIDGKPDNERVGTKGYRSPEQWEEGRSEERSDVYSLGATLYYVLYGRDPPAAECLDFPSRDVVGHRVDGALRDVCQKAMESRPADRYSSAANLARDLERWLSGEPVVAVKVDAPVWDKVRRLPAILCRSPNFRDDLIKLLILALFAGVAIVAVIRWPA
jgi:serine/threonine protein kinase